MKKILGFFVVLIALLAFNNSFAQTSNTGQNGNEAKPACAGKSAACCKDKKGTASAEQGSTKMVEAGGVSPEAKPACSGKSAACCKDKKSAASCDKEKKAENATTPQE